MRNESQANVMIREGIRPPSTARILFNINRAHGIGVGSSDPSPATVTRPASR